MKSPWVAALAGLIVAGAAGAQPAPDTAKFQPAILDLRACVRAEAPRAHIAGYREVEHAIPFFTQNCYLPFRAKLTALGAGDVASGGFRLVVGEEWAAFRRHLGGF